MTDHILADLIPFRADWYPGLTHARCGDCYDPERVRSVLTHLAWLGDQHLAILMRINALLAMPTGIQLN